MARHFNKEQTEFLTNVSRARAAGVNQATCKSVEIALLSGNQHCNFNGVVQPLTDEYLVCCQDWLFDQAVEMGQQDKINWVGVEA